MTNLLTNVTTLSAVIMFTTAPVVTMFSSVPITLQRCSALWVFFNFSHSYHHSCSGVAFCLRTVFRMLVTVKLIFLPSSESKTGQAGWNCHQSAL
jgi:hypothetical protein